MNSLFPVIIIHCDLGMFQACMTVKYWVSPKSSFLTFPNISDVSENFKVNYCTELFSSNICIMYMLLLNNFKRNKLCMFLDVYLYNVDINLSIIRLRCIVRQYWVVENFDDLVYVCPSAWI